MITKLSLRIDVIFLTFIFLGITSCRSTETDQTLQTGQSALVNVNLLETDYAGTTESNPQASLKSGMGSKSNIVQRQQVMLTPSSFIEVELTPTLVVTSGAQASLGINTMAVISGTKLGNGVKYRIIAYRQRDGAYKDSKDYTIGQPGQGLILDMGEAYYLVLYSWGTSSLPIITSGEQTNINDAQVAYNNTNRDFMYQKISYTPNNATGTVTATLRHKLASIVTTVQSINGNKVTAISNAALSTHYTNGNFLLSTGGITGRTITANQPLTFSGFPSTIVNAAAVLINNNTNGSATGSFSATISMNGLAKTISLPNSFKITPETQSTLKINMRTCGAYTSPGVWKEFTCQNMGANTNLDPLTPAQMLHGSKYQWGANTNEPGRYYSQVNDQSNSGNISGWITTAKADGSWVDTSKTTADPCPSGYKVPTQAQWQGVINNNTISRTGSWNDGGYGSVLYLGNYLMLPAAGYRNDSTGLLISRGTFGYYWASTSDTNPNAEVLSFGSSGTPAMNSFFRMNGFSVRCIAQ